ncbi:hypothetical protein BKA81DRAFT_92477 [Phyllosticta paracitricarpa]
MYLIITYFPSLHLLGGIACLPCTCVTVCSPLVVSNRIAVYATTIPNQIWKSFIHSFIRIDHRVQAVVFSPCRWFLYRTVPAYLLNAEYPSPIQPNPTQPDPAQPQNLALKRTPPHLTPFVCPMQVSRLSVSCLSTSYDIVASRRRSFTNQVQNSMDACTPQSLQWSCSPGTQG